MFEGSTVRDHQYIILDVTDKARTKTRTLQTPARWNLKILDVDKLTTQLDRETDPSRVIPRGIEGRKKAEKLSEEMPELLRPLCDASRPRKRTRRDKEPVYWWTDEIARLRRECLLLRRRAQRARNRANAVVHSEEYRVARKILRRAINDSKTESWTKLINEEDSDPWGAGYKIVTRNLVRNGPPVVRDEETMDRIVDGLFPAYPEQVWGGGDDVGDDGVPQ